MKIPFVKMHGCGNDYIFIDERTAVRLPSPERSSRLLSSRQFGIGSDGVILIRKSRVADARMVMFNADGTRGRMCGNGIRCVARWVAEGTRRKPKTISIETDAGVKPVALRWSKGKVASVSVQMGVPDFDPKLSLRRGVKRRSIGSLFELTVRTASGHSVIGYPLSMGNPHFGIVVPSVDRAPVLTLGPELECDRLFPDRTNVEFLERVGKRVISVRTWERGSGETLACGTGACAAALIAHEVLGVVFPMSILLRGGTLEISRSADGAVIMTGDANETFRGTLNLSERSQHG